MDALGHGVLAGEFGDDVFGRGARGFENIRRHRPDNRAVLFEGCQCLSVEPGSLGQTGVVFGIAGVLNGGFVKRST